MVTGNRYATFDRERGEAGRWTEVGYWEEKVDWTGQKNRY